MIGAEPSVSYEGFCNQLQRIKHQQRRISKISRRGRKPDHYTTPQPHSRTTDPNKMDWESTATAIAALRTEIAALRSTNRNGDRGTGRRVEWVLEEEIRRRKSENLCFRYGTKDHAVRQCQLLPAAHPRTTRVVAVKPGKDEITDSSDDSGKD